MSENPNPTRCGTCGTMNPPGAEVCAKCGAPLTITAGADALEGTPESPDELERIEGGTKEATPDVVVMGGMGGAPITLPTDDLDLDPDRPPRD
jgi:hypothetical protein